MKRTFLATILLVYSVTAHCGEAAFVKWAAAHAIPITTVDSERNDTDLIPLESVIGAAHVVALGEPTHAVHESLAFRNRLFHFLVERMGFTGIALEFGFTEAMSARPFVENGEGDAESAARSLSDGVNLYLENRELIQWMRDYNATAAASGHRKIRLYGLDVTAGARLGGPRLAIDSALNFLSRADPTTAQQIRDSLSDRLPRIDDYEFGSLPTSAQAEFETTIKAIAKALQKSRNSLIARSSDEEYRWALHNLDVARQLAKLLPLTPPGPPRSAGMSAWEPALTYKDSAMAENVEWALKNEGRQGRLLIFAHDGHVMNAQDDGRRWGKARKKPFMMGSHLRRAYGKNLYIITMSCATTSGGFRAAKPMEKGSIEGALAAVGLPLMFLDIRMVRQKEALDWLTKRHSFDANVDAQDLITPSTATDAFLFVHALTPAIVSTDKVP